MSVKKYRLFRICLKISLAFLMSGLLFKIMHWPAANVLISITYAISIIYVVIGVTETYQDNHKELPEKGMWSVGFLFLTPISGIVYYLSEIKKNPSE